MEGEGGLDGVVVAEGAAGGGVGVGHGDAHAADDPAGGVGGDEVAGAEKEVVEALTGLVDGVAGYDGGVVEAAGEEAFLGRGPAPGVGDVVGGGAVVGEVVVGGGDGAAAGDLGGVVGGAEGAVRVEEAPGVADGGVGGDDAVGEGGGEDVEVAEGEDEVAALGGAAEELGDVPGLGGDVAVVGVGLVVGVSGVELEKAFGLAGVSFFFWLFEVLSRGGLHVC